MFAHTRGLVPAASHGGKLYRVNYPFLPQNLVAGTKIWSHEFKLAWIFGTSPCYLFHKTLCVNCSWHSTLRTVPLCTLCRGFVAVTSCRDSCVPTLMFRRSLPLVWTFRHIVFQFLLCRSFKVLKSKKLLEVMDILAEGLVTKRNNNYIKFDHG